MRQILVITATLCVFSLFPLETMGQTTQFRFVQDAEFASLSQSTGPLSSFSVSVSRGLTTSAGATASLQYSAFTITTDSLGNFTSIIFTNEFGPIPPTAFTGQNTQNLALNIDTSTLDPTTFNSQQCTLSLSTFTETCVAGPTGVINLQFRENDAQRTIVHALQQEVTNGPITTRTHQRSDNASANYQGTVYGTAVSGASATVGVNHLSSIEMIHN